MYLCYIDESGVSSVPGNTSHFVLAGISVPVLLWSQADADVSAVLKKYGLEDEELHTGWVLRPYLEQTRIVDFDKLDWKDRRSAVQRERRRELLRLQQASQSKPYQQTKKNYRHTEPYIHLTFSERKNLVGDVATMVGKWGYAKLFAECIDKVFFDPAKARRTIDEQSFEQVISRFEQYLVNTSKGQKSHGLIVHDNNQTIAAKHTKLMRDFRRNGTFWTKVDRIVETPLFVDSSLTRMVQVADLCAYALRRYLENGEEDLFQRIYVRADQVGGRVLGVRHFTDPTKCSCLICQSHKDKQPKNPTKVGGRG